MSQSIDDMLQLVVLSNKSVFTDILDEHEWETIFRGEEGTAPDELNCLVCDQTVVMRMYIIRLFVFIFGVFRQLRDCWLLQ